MNSNECPGIGMYIMYICMESKCIYDVWMSEWYGIYAYIYGGREISGQEISGQE